MWQCVLSLLFTHGPIPSQSLVTKSEAHVTKRFFFYIISTRLWHLWVLEMPSITPEIDSAPTDRCYKYPSLPNPNPMIPLPPPVDVIANYSRLTSSTARILSLIEKHTGEGVSLATPSTPAAPYQLLTPFTHHQPRFRAERLTLNQKVDCVLHTCHEHFPSLRAFLKALFHNVPHNQPDDHSSRHKKMVQHFLQGKNDIRAPSIV